MRYTEKMNDRLRTILLAMLVLAPLCAAHGQVQSDTLSIRFRLDSIRIDMDYAGNGAAWEAFRRRFRESYGSASPRSLRLDIFSGASPEGPAAHNRWLGESRGVAIRHLVRQSLGDRIGSIVVHNEAARWDGLYSAVAASREPWRDEVLRIIELPPTSEQYARDHRELKLRALRGGTVWAELLSRYLAPLRSGATAILSWESGRDTIVVRDTVVMVQPVYVNCDSLRQPVETADSVSPRRPVLRQPVWILRTNLPLLGTGTPNLQVEWSLGHKDKWSLNVEGIWSWWTFGYNAFANQIIYGSVELRRWLGRRWRHHTLDGWHIGLGVGGGYGDVEWRSKGYQAEVYSGYLNIGWQRRFGRRRQWAFDAGIGLGFAHIPWRRYDGSTLYPVGREEEHDDHLMWQETSHSNWIGTPHLNISLGYVFPQKDAAWRRARAMERDARKYDYLHFRDSMIAREKFVKDSLKIARKHRLEEIEIMPKAERKAALAELDAADRQAKRAAREARRKTSGDDKAGKLKAKEDKRLRKQRLREEREAYRRERREIREWAKTPEGRMAVRQLEAEDDSIREREKEEAKIARKQAKIQRKMSRIKARNAARQQRNLENLRRELEKADYKYNTGGERQ